jgi:FMNH2-dependent dimethyl sulfone monooxygenase
VDDNVLEPRPTVYAGGESEAAEELIAEKCDGYLMHGDSPVRVAEKIADMRQRKERHGLPPMLCGVAGYTIVRDTPEEAEAERQRITDVNQNAPGYQNYQQWLGRKSKSSFRWRINRYRTADWARDW